MTTPIPCSHCGKAIEVTADQAGARLQCLCGNSIEVPSLRELRAMGLAQVDIPSRDTNELVGFRRKRLTAFIWIFSGLALLVCWLAASYLVVPSPAPRWAFVVSWAAALVAYILFFGGFALWAISKGYYGWVGLLLGLWAPIGWFVIVFLPDRCDRPYLDRSR